MKPWSWQCSVYLSGNFKFLRATCQTWFFYLIITKPIPSKEISAQKPISEARSDALTYAFLFWACHALQGQWHAWHLRSWESLHHPEFSILQNLDSVCTCLRIGALQLGHAIRAYHGHLTDLRKTIFIRRPVENGAMSHSTGHGRVGNKASPQVVFHDDEGLPVT